MGKRLQDNLSSKYFEAANKLNSKASRRRIVAYVESYDDIFFWRSVLSRFENDKLYFEVMLPTHDFKLERGKKAVMMNLLSDKVGKNMIACVDADYDFLVQGKTFTSETILSNPYIFHTYAYAIENLQCFSSSLHDVCVAVTLNDHDIFNMEEYLRQFSIAIFPLFVWNIWYYRSDTYRDFTMTDFNRIIETGNFVMEKADSIIANVRRKVQQKVKQLQQKHPNAKESYLAVKDDLRRLGVKPETAYLYIQGHHLFDKVVVPMMKKVCDRLIREREQEIRRQSVHNTQYRNEMSCYNKSVIDVSGMLRRNVGYMRSDLFLRIVDDVGKFLNKSADNPSPASNQT
ncbi:MAG: DUF4435 domain-containing protein [Prevotella sp.]|nr:DUF4435 domain-containing protein [Prevotella sp.]